MIWDVHQWGIISNNATNQNERLRMAAKNPQAWSKPWNFVTGCPTGAVDWSTVKCLGSRGVGAPFLLFIHCSLLCHCFGYFASNFGSYFLNHISWIILWPFCLILDHNFGFNFGRLRIAPRLAKIWRCVAVLRHWRGVASPPRQTAPPGSVRWGPAAPGARAAPPSRRAEAPRRNDVKRCELHEDRRLQVVSGCLKTLWQNVAKSKLRLRHQIQTILRIHHNEGWFWYRGFLKMCLDSAMLRIANCLCYWEPKFCNLRPTSRDWNFPPDSNWESVRFVPQAFVPQICDQKNMEVSWDLYWRIRMTTWHLKMCATLRLLILTWARSFVVHSSQLPCSMWNYIIPNKSEWNSFFVVV